MKYLCILFFLPVNGFCELEWSNSTSFQSEPGNAISSLMYSIFGLIGLTLKNYSSNYYFLMNLFILTGISSFLHHYYYSINTWTHIADIICVELLTIFTLFYIVLDNEYNISRFIRLFFNLMISVICLSMLVLFMIGSNQKTLLIQISMGAIIFTQFSICCYQIYNNTSIKIKIIKTAIWNGTLFSLGATMWYIDQACPIWMYNSRLNGHTIWHITVAWALFNTINLTNFCRYNYNQIKVYWKPLFKCCPEFIYLIIIQNEKSNIKHNYTNIDLEEIKLLSDNKSHRRVNTYS